VEMACVKEASIGSGGVGGIVGVGSHRYSGVCNTWKCFVLKQTHIYPMAVFIKTRSIDTVSQKQQDFDCPSRVPSGYGRQMEAHY